MKHQSKFGSISDQSPGSEPSGRESVTTYDLILHGKPRRNHSFLFDSYDKHSTSCRNATLAKNVALLWISLLDPCFLIRDRQTMTGPNKCLRRLPRKLQNFDYAVQYVYHSGLGKQHKIEFPGWIIRTIVDVDLVCSSPLVSSSLIQPRLAGPKLSEVTKWERVWG